jgi:hypothetical protein
MLAVFVGTTSLASAGCDRLRARSRGAPRVDVREAPAHEDETAMTFDASNAKILSEMGGAYEKSCPPHQSPPRNAPRCMELRFYAFPIVPSSWSAGQPVSAWATCVDEATLPACRTRMISHGGDIAGTIAVRVGDKERPGRSESGWEKAIDDASKTHGLLVAPRGPVLRLGHEREKE